MSVWCISKIVCTMVHLDSAAPSGAYTYDKDLTPRITSVIPARGSTAGGTDITITGSGFGSVSADVTVTIMEISCVVTAVTATEVTCMTGYHGPTNTTHPGKGAVMLNVVPKGFATAAADTYWYVDLWSRTTTWGGGPPPIEGDSVEIPRGQTVLLDISPPQMVAIVVMGKLIFDRKDLTLEASYIIILGDGATLEIGTEEEPFLQKVSSTQSEDAVPSPLPLGQAFPSSRANFHPSLSLASPAS